MEQGYLETFHPMRCSCHYRGGGAAGLTCKACGSFPKLTRKAHKTGIRTCQPAQLPAAPGAASSSLILDDFPSPNNFLQQAAAAEPTTPLRTAYSSNSTKDVKVKNAMKQQTVIKKDISNTAAVNVLKSSTSTQAASKPSIMDSATKAVYTGALPPTRQNNITYSNRSATKAYAENPRNYDVGGASESLFGDSSMIHGTPSYPTSGGGLSSAYTPGMASPFLSGRQTGNILSPAAALSSSMSVPLSANKFNASSIVGMNTNTSASFANTSGFAAGTNSGGRYLSPPVNDINSPGKYLSDLVGGAGRRQTPNAHDFVKSHDAVTYLDDLGSIQGEWLNNAKHFIMQYLAQAYGEFNGAVMDIMAYIQQRNLAMQYFPGGGNTIKDPLDFYVKVQKILLLESPRCDIAISAGVADINLQSLCRRLEDADINVDRSLLYAFYSRYTLFCSPSVANDLFNSLLGAASSSKMSSKVGSHSAEITELIKTMRSKNWKSTRSQNNSNESDLTVSIFLNICHNSSHNYNYNASMHSSSHLNGKYFASSVGEIKSCSFGEHSCGLVRQTGRSTRDINYNVYVVDGHHIDIVNIDSGRDNCYESIVTLLLIIVKFNTSVKESVHQLMKNVFSEYQYIRDYPGLRRALEVRGLALKYVDDEGDD